MGPGSETDFTVYYISTPNGSSAAWTKQAMLRLAIVICILSVQTLIVSAFGLKIGKHGGNTTVAGCNSYDMGKINAMGEGNAKGAFPVLTSKCGRKAFQIVGGFQHKKFTECMHKNIDGLSKTCASCYSDEAAYVANSCKLDCSLNWCSTSCLGCRARRRSQTLACVGSPTPEAFACTR